MIEKLNKVSVGHRVDCCSSAGKDIRRQFDIVLHNDSIGLSGVNERVKRLKVAAIATVFTCQ